MLHHIQHHEPIPIGQQLHCRLMVHLLHSLCIIRLDPALTSHWIDCRRVAQQCKYMVARVTALLPSGAVELVGEDQPLLICVRRRREELVHVVRFPHQDAVRATEAKTVILEEVGGSGDF